MEFKTKPQNVYSYLTLMVVLVYCAFACRDKPEANRITRLVTETDSVLIWIAAGRNDTDSKTVRKESLLKAYKVANSKEVDSLKLKYLSKIQWSFLGVEDSLWFRKTNKEANLLSRELADSIRLAGSFWDLGEFFNRNGVMDSSYFNLSKAQKIFKSLGDNLNAGKLEYDMARIQADVKNYTSAEVGTIRAIELLKPLEESVMLYRCYNQLGIISKDLEEYEKSLEYYKIAATYLEKSIAREELAREVDINMGVTFQEKGANEEAAYYFKKVLNQDSLRFKNPSYYAKALSNLAISSYKFDSNSNSESLFLKSLKIRDSIGDKAGLAGSYYDFAEYYLYKKDTTKALENAKKAKSYAEESNNNERLLESLSLLTQLDTKNASIYGQRYMALNDSLQQEERKIRNKFARIRFETDEVVAENKQLTRQKQLWAGIALSILLLGTAGYVIVDQRRKNQKLRFQQEQQVSNEKIFNLMLSEKQKFEEGKKLEQKRISEELHDGVLGKMLGARMVLTGLNKKADDEAISERANAIAALKDVEGEVRSISHELSHAAYQEIHNFIRSIQDLLEKTSGAANINHNFNYSENVDWDGLEGDIKINLYRIVQESLQNAVKHSKCKNLTLDFTAIDNNLQISIQDDGIGFDPGKRKRGIGMRNIKSRIEKINGTWNIDSRPGSGTSVKLTIPIDYFSKETQVFDEFEQVEKV